MVNNQPKKKKLGIKDYIFKAFIAIMVLLSILLDAKNLKDVIMGLIGVIIGLIIIKIILIHYKKKASQQEFVDTNNNNENSSVESLDTNTQNNQKVYGKAINDRENVRFSNMIACVKVIMVILLLILTVLMFVLRVNSTILALFVLVSGAGVMLVAFLNNVEKAEFFEYENIDMENDNSIQYCTLEDEIRANQWDVKGKEDTNIPFDAKLYSEEIDKKYKDDGGAIKYY